MAMEVRLPQMLLFAPFHYVAVLSDDELSSEAFPLFDSEINLSAALPSMTQSWDLKTYALPSMTQSWDLKTYALPSMTQSRFSPLYGSERGFLPL
ncbi:hypothetical protein ACHQM5_024028 [Ranunculus cassubicifolius]